ncbi:glutaredoxin family protein [Thalassobacillus devorans]|uniref:glutaredoxin family protein n=1 Tax=Thalassobacillus devorans TaxID=279813 RepID=UPI00048B143F|nr:glutaredoxin family protein [Thalassobacillus devorans]
MTKHDVVVYVSNNCSHCEKVVAKLKEWDVNFREKNVSENREHFKELQRQKIYGTPAAFIDGEQVLGFQKGKLQRKLGIYNDISFNVH